MEHEDLIQQHENKFTEIDENLRDIKFTLGMKDVRNGERKRMLEELKEEDKTIHARINNIQEDVSFIKGKIEGKDISKDYLQAILSSKLTWIGIIVTIIIFIYGLFFR